MKSPREYAICESKYRKITIYTQILLKNKEKLQKTKKKFKNNKEIPWKSINYKENQYNFNENREKQ